MQFLRTLFWVVVAVIAVIFSVRNWTPVTIHLWGGIDADVKLPVMLLVAFAVGLLPPLILYRATRWRLRRRLETAERALALNGTATPADQPPADPAPATQPVTMPIPPAVA
ncbi:lipopolysaccharide assembly protein LapA domain-containing protein [Sphingomonas profundi]|uniref:lipopolysaccharide assembly protein LapA domain-containing protein n=1 Tax=Alterirhizorhabdus profundi TaxID=2681549 RepID=UPI0012E7401F|nr:lipopolysaccharide assembly protein LapA domain-containing protein [Sphingomonas profundi]